jgi:hypothetical protein
MSIIIKTMSEFPLYTEITGRDLKHLKLCKILHDDLIHNGFQYQEGLNILIDEFNPSDNCSKGGLYFCKFEDFPFYLNYGDKIAKVTLPDDARVYVEQNKFKADQIILSDIRNISELKEWNDDEFCMNIISKEKYCAMRYVKNQTPELCLAAVQQNGLALQHVKNQTPKLCMVAVQKNGWSLRYVQNQTPEICLVAVQQNGLTLKYVTIQTPELCLAAVREYGYALQHVKNQTPELCLAAVQQSGYALQYVQNQTPEICIAAVQQNGLALAYVETQTPEICIAAVQQNGYALQFVENQTPE